MSETNTTEALPRNNYELEGAVLTYGFKSNYTGVGSYRCEIENVRKVLISGVINSPSARASQTDYDKKRYGRMGDIPVDSQRICLYIWKSDTPSQNDLTYADQALWAGPVDILEGCVAHTDPGDPGDAIGATHPSGKVEFPLEKGKLVLDFQLFIDLYEDIIARAEKLGMSLDKYLSDNIVLTNNDYHGDNFKDRNMMTKVVMGNISPAVGATAKVAKILSVQPHAFQIEEVAPYTKKELGVSQKVINNQWQEVILKQLDIASRFKYKNYRELHEIEVLQVLANKIGDKILAEKTSSIFEHCNNLPIASI